MKIVQIIKIAEYDPTISGRHSEYQGYCLSTLQKSQPHIKVGELPAQHRYELPVLCSMLTRSKETALLLSSRPRPIKLLNEIRFDLSHLLNEQEFDTCGSGLVRERFLNAFAKDNLLESRADIFTRIHRLLNYLRSLPQDDILCISHSFFMKVLEAYINTDGEIETRPELISDFISIKKHTYPYMEGFEFKL